MQNVTPNRMLRADSEALFQCCFAQVLVKADKLKASGGVFSPEQGGGKLQGVGGSERMNGQKPLCTEADRFGGLDL